MENAKPIFDELLEKLKKSNNYTESDINLIKKSYKFACEKHKDMKRLSGDDYISHPLSVAMILADLNSDALTISCALLHEVMNNGDTYYNEIESKFDEQTAKIVDSISKINKLELPDESESSAMYLRKVLIGLADDVRVLYIKLADRLHNMRTIWAVNPEKQKKKANETLSVLVPIAHRLGINSIKSELENLCLKYLKPDVYKDIEDKLNESKEDLKDCLDNMIEEISDILNENNVEFEIKGRVKSIYSIYNKLYNKGRTWDEIYDILALRVYVEKESDCYLTVGLIHSKFRPVPRRFKDYIANPKENMYQSLHTTVFGDDGKLYEIQIRTYEMDEFAEKGLASHWSYKEKGSKKIQNIMEQKLEMFRSIIESSSEDDYEYNSQVQKEYFDDLIYVFTPKGDVVELPKGSTPVDFAYRIHSDVGDKTVGAIVNDSIVPLAYELNDNDIVRIKTSASASPNKDWLTFVKTSQARNKIRSFFSKKDKSIYIEKGKEAIFKELRRKNIPQADFLTDENISKILKDLKLNDIDDLYLSVGSTRYTAGYIVNLATEDKETVQDALIEKIRNNSNNIQKESFNSDIIIDGVDNVQVNLAKCCKPIHGEPIIGFITKTQGISIHRIDCHNVIDKNERLVQASWNDKTNNVYKTDLVIEVDNVGNYLLDIISTGALIKVYVDAVESHQHEDKTVYDITVKVNDYEELVEYIKELRKLSFVINVYKKK
ncbi:MAG: bifunctional (p)ppGpp synthetase/guanosine-3',5'-bis(diphosphate) 3'-pyrophosphohydrolase [Bacilli bacterium]|nr:bifunctional (p)ppGpp synthetase/guanosine-3',5'-bis(diphosphate) 3'-pyrophosphohydrolase [Bacilli bacterium]